MSQETKKVLEMLASGQITADDAEKLLEKLGASSGPASGRRPGRRKSAPRAGDGRILPVTASRAQKLRFLRVVVDSPDRDQVNVRVPLAISARGNETAGRHSAPSERQAGGKRHRPRRPAGFEGRGTGGTNSKDLHVDVDEQERGEGPRLLRIAAAGLGGEEGWMFRGGGE